MNKPKKLLLALLLMPLTSIAEPIKIGVQTSLTGDAATFGADIKNALEFAREKLAPGQYEFIYEDEKCDSAEGVKAAQKLSSVDKVRYVLGLSCNNALLASAPIYNKAKVISISATASSGDVLDVGKYMFRLFPNDAAGAVVLMDYIAKHHKQLGILTEQTEYTVMMQRTAQSVAKNYPGLSVTTDEFDATSKDFRSQLLRLRSRGVDALYINSGTEAPLIIATKQVRAMKWDVPIYTVYFGGSPAFLEGVKELANGVTYSDLPFAREHMGKDGNTLLDEYIARYGQPKSFELVTSFAFESFRILNEAIKSGIPVEEYLAKTKFQGPMLGAFEFDEHGAVKGLNFQMKRVVDGKAVRLDESKH